MGGGISSLDHLIVRTFPKVLIHMKGKTYEGAKNGCMII